MVLPVFGSTSRNITQCFDEMPSSLANRISHFAPLPITKLQTELRKQQPYWRVRPKQCNEYFLKKKRYFENNNQIPSHAVVHNGFDRQYYFKCNGIIRLLFVHCWSKKINRYKNKNKTRTETNVDDTNGSANEINSNRFSCPTKKTFKILPIIN